jgi:hypothetical protein
LLAYHLLDILKVQAKPVSHASTLFLHVVDLLYILRDKIEKGSAFEPSFA